MKALLTISILLAGTSVFAQTSAKDGIAKLKENVDNAKYNLSEYKKNLKTVEGNMGEVSKAKSQVDGQRKQIAQSIKENQASITALEKQEKQVNDYIADEKKLSDGEAKKIQDLEKQIAALKENQAKRQANTLQYQEQLKQLAAEKQQWKTRADELNKVQTEVQTRYNAVNTQETEWKNKKRGYEGEVSRWQKEVDRHRKMHEHAANLSESN